jgi:hypothetical protein
MALDLRSELQRIYETYGKLTPRLVVEEWADPASPFHHKLEWDDEAAAEGFRLVQASQIIRSVKITFTKQTGSTGKVRAFHAVRTEAGNTYKPTEEIAQSEFLSKMLMQNMEREWRDLKARYERFAEFWLMVNDDNPEADAV